MEDPQKNIPVEESMDEKKRRLKEKFDAKSEEDKKKFDRLKIKEDSLRNKSTLSGFDDEAPVFNQLENK